MRIVSLLPTATEMLCALGLSRQIVGRSEHCRYPPEIRSRPIVVKSAAKKIAAQDSLAIHRAVLKLKRENTHPFDLDLRALRRLKPDLVVTQTLCTVCAASHSEVEEAVRSLSPRPKTVSVHARRLSEIFDDFRRLGAVTGRAARAARVVETLEGEMDETRRKVAGAGRPRVWCCEWLEPLMAAGHWIPELVEAAGGEDGLGVKGNNSRWITWEEVRRYDPEVILVMPCSYTIAQSLRERGRLARRPGWENLSAVRGGRVHALNTSFLHHAGPRLGKGARFLSRLIHPELFSDRMRPCGSHAALCS